MNKLVTLINEKDLKKRVKELGKEIEKDYKGEDITFICILKGSIHFFSDLTRSVKNNTYNEFMKVSSYGASTTSSGEIHVNLDLNEKIQGKNIIVVEDIIDSGRTLSYLLKYLSIKKPKTLKLCTLLNKPSRREIKGLKVDYIGFTIPDYFVVGYGLDLDQQYRNIPCIKCFVKSKEEEIEVKNFKTK